MTEPSKALVDGTRSVTFLWDKLMGHVVARDMFGLNSKPASDTEKCRRRWLCMLTVIHALHAQREGEGTHF